MLRDIEYFEAKLSKMDGFGDTADHLKSLVKAKEIKSMTVAAPVVTSEAEDKAEPEDKADSEGSDAAPETKNGNGTTEAAPEAAAAEATATA